MNADTKAMIAAGERRLAERRAAPQPDPMLELVNRITEDRDRLKRENAALRRIVCDQSRLLDRAQPFIHQLARKGATQ